MKVSARRGILLVAICGLQVGCDSQHRDTFVEGATADARKAAYSVKTGWTDLNRKAETLDPSSSMRELEDTRKKLLKRMSEAGTTANSEWSQTKSQLARLDAAERLKDAQKKLEDLKESGQRLSKTADEASKTLTDLETKVAEAKKAYESAKTETSQFLP